MALVLPEDEQLVTPFTFYTMSQCRPCNLDIKGNGSRSNFEHGFPGLECRTVSFLVHYIFFHVLYFVSL